MRGHQLDTLIKREKIFDNIIVPSGFYGMWRRNCNSACTCKGNEQSTACSDTISLSDRMGCFWWEAGRCCFCHHRTGGNRAGEIPFFSCTSCQKACGWRVYRKFSKVQKWRGNVWISAVCFLNPRFDIEYIERIRYKTDIDTKWNLLSENL